jgi:hypothetical protein
MKRLENTMRKRLSLVVIVFTFFAILVARAAAAADEPRVYQLTVHPGAPPAAALRYRLMPDPSDLTAGNAAPVYLSALLLAPKLTDEQQQQLDKWMDMPLEKLPRDQVQRFLDDSCKTAFAQAEIAARRDFCHWDMPWREQSFMALLPHLNGMRQLTRAIALRAKLELAEGHFDDAARTLATGFAMARHVGQGDSVLIEALVGSAMARSLSLPLRDWAAAPNAPSLYWSLAALPRPFVDAGAALRREHLILWLPDLRAARDRSITPEQWKRIVEQAVIATNAGAQTNHGLADQIKIALDAAATLPKAKAYLIEQGMPKVTVESMPAFQAVAIWSFDDYERKLEAMEKWFGVPYWQAQAGLARATEEFMRAPESNTNVLLAFVPAITRAYTSCMQADREIAVMQTIEAIRAYAAAHGGKLPQSLEDLSDATPAPIDPMTGTNFDYTPGDGGFVLEAAPVADRPDTGLKYQVTLVP